MKAIGNNRMGGMRGVDDDTFAAIVKACTSIRQVLLKLGMNAGSAYTLFNKRVKALNIDTSHFVKLNHTKGNGARPLEEILVVNSDYTNGNGLKKRLLKNGLLKNECYECGMGPLWNNIPLVLQMDHINGIRNDNRISNLRILCPNCHTQTDTFCSRSWKKNTGRITGPKPGKKSSQPKTKKCLDCASLISYKATRCKPCSFTARGPGIDWPAINVLVKMVSKFGYVGTGKKLGIGQNSIRYYLKKHDAHSGIKVIRSKKIEWPSMRTLQRMLEVSNYSAVARELGVSDNAIRKHIKNNR